MARTPKQPLYNLIQASIFVKMKYLSPLRYPGGKAKFFHLIKENVERWTRPDSVFIEPFCGGAGVALNLLASCVIKRIALNDRDPLVAAFWQVAFGKSGSSERAAKCDFDWLIDQITSKDISIKEWKIQKNYQPKNIREAAYKCLFLNRTSFNGIIEKAGPIGGWEQKKQTLNVRFNRADLVLRLQTLWNSRDSVISVTCKPWEEVLQNQKDQNSIFYFDPPYYHRAEQLYSYVFDNNAHNQLRDILAATKKTPWILSYDDTPEVRELYHGISGIDGLVIDKTYSAHPLGGGRFVGRELFFSNRPLATKARNTSGEHSAVSVVGKLTHVAAPISGPMRIPLSGKIEERKKQPIGGISSNECQK